MIFFKSHGEKKEKELDLDSNEDKIELEKKVGQSSDNGCVLHKYLTWKKCFRILECIRFQWSDTL